MQADSKAFFEQQCLSNKLIVAFPNSGNMQSELQSNQQIAESNNSISEVSGLSSIKEEKKESSGSDSVEAQGSDSVEAQGSDSLGRSGFNNYSFHKHQASAKRIM